MKNELLHVGPFTVYGYGLMIATGILAGFLLVSLRAKRRQLNQDFLLTFILWAIGGGFLGAKLMFWIVNIGEIIKDPRFLIDTLGDGFVVIGGILLGIFCTFRFCRRRGQEYLYWFDLLMPSVALAQGFGRIGCLLAGCCYGKETHGVFHIVFQESAYAPNGVPLLPTQIMASTMNFVNAVGCLLASRFVRRGQVAALYLLNYSVFRFFLEFFRGDESRGFIGRLSTSQFISLFTFALGIGLWIYTGRKQGRQKAGALLQ